MENVEYLTQEIVNKFNDVGSNASCLKNNETEGYEYYLNEIINTQLCNTLNALNIYDKYISKCQECEVISKTHEEMENNWKIVTEEFSKLVQENKRLKEIVNGHTNEEAINLTLTYDVTAGKWVNLDV